MGAGHWNSPGDEARRDRAGAARMGCRTNRSTGVAGGGHQRHASPSRSSRPFVDLVDATDLRRWHAQSSAWATALGRFSPGTAYRVTGCGSRREADQLVSDARPAYLRLTGCLE
ncbi:hypothetical protein AB0D98_23425 [Streptomyces sp. NPDC047987]|uniref:hypothetical protein n=1 Tax=unclassified Streptomyces TaxID=2593676 RepID=UPI0034146081